MWRLAESVDLRDVQVAATTPTRARLCAPPKRAGQNLDRHPDYILAAYTASGT
jgi:hypothetical protein